MAKTAAREHLITSAKHLFSCMAYEKVSTRLIAEKAGVNSAMIRYYFGSKEGLFEAMITSAMTPIIESMHLHNKKPSAHSLEGIMRAHYQVMSQDLEFPRMLIRIMTLPSSDVQRQLTEKLFDQLTSTISDEVFFALHDGKTLRADLDIKKCKLTFISMLMFPYIAPPIVLAKHNIELTPSFLEEMLQHNLSVISSGMLEKTALDQGL
ncbi:TetR/AcrR family transcriptional regulator [Vibrio rarus]|uniref:TetR/AcrR family transcriptional regulator n=1 Tax=Vibrio rarus TaxID=413403 RepID=UPI0021C2F0B7|nr:TetR/AcrR family transcriptional regulator [Vibrio rarus]